MRPNDTALNEIVDGRIRDSEGDLWPITGHWCQLCRMPLNPVDGATTHPNCEEKK